MEHFDPNPLKILLQLAGIALGLFAAFGIVILIMVNFPHLSGWIWLLIFAAAAGIGALVIKFLEKKKKEGR